MATPALQRLAEKKKTPIPVFFQTRYLSDIFCDAEFMTILQKKPPGQPFASSHHPQRRKSESDYEAYFRIICREKLTNLYVPYVDCSNTLKLNRNAGVTYVAIFHGCLNTKREIQVVKSIGWKTLSHLVKALRARNIVPVVLGSRMDARFWGKVDLSKCKNYLGKLPIRQSISILSQCDYFISNDTGLYHAASALGMKGLVCWHKTSFKKNRSPNTRISHCINREGDLGIYRKAIDAFIDENYI